MKKLLILFTFGIFLISACNQQPVYDVSYVLENSESLLDENIKVEGTAVMVDARCTAIECTKENPCCNGCAADVYLIKPTDRSINLRVNGVGCKGNECNITCSPIIEEVYYIVEGLLRENDFGRLGLNLKNFEIIKDQFPETKGFGDEPIIEFVVDNLDDDIEKYQGGCDQDSDCIPFPGCRPHNCINMKYADELKDQLIVPCEEDCSEQPICSCVNDNCKVSRFTEGLC